MKLLFSLLLVVSSTAFLCFGDDVDINEILEKRELGEDTGRHEKDDVTAISEYKIAEIADNKMEDTYTEERKECLRRKKDCGSSKDCCKGHLCACDYHGPGCKCIPRPLIQLGTNSIKCCE